MSCEVCGCRCFYWRCGTPVNKGDDTFCGMCQMVDFMKLNNNKNTSVEYYVEEQGLWNFKPPYFIDDAAPAYHPIKYLRQLMRGYKGSKHFINLVIKEYKEYNKIFYIKVKGKTLFPTSEAAKNKFYKIKRVPNSYFLKHGGEFYFYESEGGDMYVIQD